MAIDYVWALMVTGMMNWRTSLVVTGSMVETSSGMVASLAGGRVGSMNHCYRDSAACFEAGSLHQ